MRVTDEMVRVVAREVARRASTWLDFDTSTSLSVAVRAGLEEAFAGYREVDSTGLQGVARHLRNEVSRLQEEVVDLRRAARDRRARLVADQEAHASHRETSG